MAYPVRDINPSKGCIIQPFCRLYYTTKSSGHKKGASKGVKRPLYECSKKGRKCYILSNWSGIKELPLTLQTGMSGESLLILIPQILLGGSHHFCLTSLVSFRLLIWFLWIYHRLPLCQLTI